MLTNRRVEENQSSSQRIVSLEKAPTIAPKFSSLKENFATQKLPFFCSQELKWERKTHVPLRIRMGSVAHTDWLEQKPNAQIPH